MNELLNRTVCVKVVLRWKRSSFLTHSVYRRLIISRCTSGLYAVWHHVTCDVTREQYVQCSSTREEIDPYSPHNTLLYCTAGCLHLHCSLSLKHRNINILLFLFSINKKLRFRREAARCFKSLSDKRNASMRFVGYIICCDSFFLWLIGGWTRREQPWFANRL